jgi:hypothetical protein
MSSLVWPAASVRFPSVPRRVGDARKGIANRRDCRSKFNNRTRLGRITVQASVSSETDAEASDEDIVVNHKLFAMGFCDDGDGGSWMGDDDSGVASGGHNVRVRPSLGGKIAAAFALGIAGQLTGAYSVRAAPKAAAAATATAHKPSPNLFTLPEGARKSLDDFVINGAKDVRGVMDAVDDNVNDPWDIEDVWLIIAWHFAIVKGRRKLYDYLKERDPENTVEWEKSFWNWLGGPMKVIGGLWIGMYLWDNGCRVGELLDMSAFLPATIMEQFDRGMYTLAGGIIAVMATDNYLPEILTNRLGVKDSSTKLVLTRLAVVTGALCTAISSALVFGLPPKSLLGFGGIGGLTFGLAAKDLVSNFIGGSMLAIMRPFSPWREDLPHGRRRQVQGHERAVRRRLPRERDRLVPDHLDPQGHEADDGSQRFLPRRQRDQHLEADGPHHRREHPRQARRRPGDPEDDRRDHPVPHGPPGHHQPPDTAHPRALPRHQGRPPGDSRRDALERGEEGPVPRHAAGALTRDVRDLQEAQYGPGMDRAPDHRRGQPPLAHGGRVREVKALNTTTQM